MSLSVIDNKSHHLNQSASKLDSIGKILVYPVDLFLDQGARVVRSLNPGHLDQLNCIVKELAVRVLRIFLCLIILALLPFGIIGGTFRAIASLYRKEFVVIEPNEERGNRGTIRQITIATFNACMMPSWINIAVHKCRTAEERVEPMSQGALKSDADVLCIQEAFHLGAADQIVDRIRSKYPYIIYNPACKYYKIGSGLFIASKFPMEDPQYWEHSRKIGTEVFSGKGTLAVKVRLNERQVIPILNTHLEAGLDNPLKGVSCRVKQLEAIKRYAAPYCQGSEMSFVCGDMNISSQEETEDLRALKDLIVIAKDPTRENGTARKEHLSSHEESFPDQPCHCLAEVDPYRDIDYIGVLNPPTITNTTPIESHLECFNGVSDHLAYVATFELPPVKDNLSG